MTDYTKKNIKSLKPSATLVINEKSKALISQGKKIYKFGFGQSPFPVPQKVVEALKKNAEKKNYMPIQGSLDLRNSIADYINKKTENTFSAENIIVSPGSKEMMFLLHMGFDGDIIFSATSGTAPIVSKNTDLMLVCQLSALCVTQAVGSAIKAAREKKGDQLPCWADLKT